MHAEATRTKKQSVWLVQDGSSSLHPQPDQSEPEEECGVGFGDWIRIPLNEIAAGPKVRVIIPADVGWIG